MGKIIWEAWKSKDINWKARDRAAAWERHDYQLEFVKKKLFAHAGLEFWLLMIMIAGLLITCWKYI